MIARPAITAFAFIVAAPALAAEAAMPNVVQALLDAAYDTGDPDEIAAVVRAVLAVFPDYEPMIRAQSDAKIASLAPPQPEMSTQTDDKSVSTSILAIRPWDGKIQASAVFSSGNSENSAVGIAVDAARVAGDFTHNVTAYFDLGESNGVTNQKRWGGSYQLDYNFGERTYAYWRASYDEDEFSGFDYRLFSGAGLGHYFYKSKPFSWKAEGGPGFRYSPRDISREVEQEFAAYAASEIDWIIREGLKFEQDVNVTWTSPTTTFQSITALTTELIDGLSTGISFEYRYETDPPDNRENTDTIARASVIYGF